MTTIINDNPNMNNNSHRTTLFGEIPINNENERPGSDTVFDVEQINNQINSQCNELNPMNVINQTINMNDSVAVINIDTNGKCTNSILSKTIFTNV